MGRLASVSCSHRVCVETIRHSTTNPPLKPSQPYGYTGSQSDACQCQPLPPAIAPLRKSSKCQEQTRSQVVRGRRWRDTRRAGCRRPASPQHGHLPACLRAARPSMPTQRALPRTSTKQSWKICGRLASQRSLQNPLRLDTETRGPIGEDMVCDLAASSLCHGRRLDWTSVSARSTKHEAGGPALCRSLFSHILNDCLFFFS
ncbi:hypothetical protein V8C44DRAFT_267807 [Trichoderma aethiopicum]